MKRSLSHLPKHKQEELKEIVSAQAQKDARKLAATGLKRRAEDLLNIPTENPFQTPPPLIMEDYEYARFGNVIDE